MIQFLENFVTEGWKDRQALFYRTLLVTAGGPKTYKHEDIQMDKNNKEKIFKKPTLSLVNAGPPDRVSVLSTKCGGCHPKGLIVASSHKVKQIIILQFLYAKADSPFCYTRIKIN